MILVILIAVLAVSEAATIEKRHSSPFQTRKSRGLFSRTGSFGIKSPTVPSGGYTNDDLGVVVDAVAPGTRTSGVEPSGLGGPRASYGSLDSKVGDAAFKVGGGVVQETASGIASLFGPGKGKKAHVGLPGIGIGSGSSSLDASGIKATDAKVTGLDVSKTTYESIPSTSEDARLGIKNAGVKGGAIGSGSIFSSGSGQANLGLPGIGIGSGSSSLDASGIKAADAKVTGLDVSKTTYESIPSTGGDARLGIKNAGVKGGAIGSGSIFSSGSGQANLGLPGIGIGSGSSSLDASGIKAAEAKVTGSGVSKTGGDAKLGIKSAGVTGGAIGSGSIFSSGSGQANLGLPGIGIGSGSSSLDASGIKAADAKVTGLDVSKTTYESIPSTGGDARLGIKNAGVKGGAIGSGSIFSSGSGQANLGLPGIGIGSESSSLDASGIKAAEAKVTGSGVSKTGGDAKLGIKSAGVKGGAIGSGSIFSSGSGQANLGLPGIGIGSGSSSLDASGIKAAEAKVTGSGVSKTGGDAKFGIKSAGVKGGATGTGSIFSSGSGQANLGLPGIGIGSGSSSLDASGIRAADAKVTSLDVSKTTYESIDSSGGNAGLGIENAAVKGSVTGSDSIFSSGSGQAKLGLPGIGIGSGSSSLDVSGIKAADAKVTGSGISKTRYESIHSSGGDAGLGIENAAVKAGVTGSGSIFASGLGQANLGLPGIGSGSSSLDASGIKAANAKVTGSGVSKPTYETILSTGGDAGLGIENAAVKGGATGSGAIFSSGSNQANLGLPGIGISSGSGSLDASGIRAADGKVTGLDVSKTTYESIDFTGGDAGLGIENEAVKGGVTGSDSIFSSGSGQANLGLPGIGIGSESSSLDASGIKATEAKVTGSGVSKTRYESIHSSGGDAGLEIENAAVKGGVTGSGSIFTSGSGQGNLGLPGIGIGSGSSSLDASGIEAADGKVTGFGVSKTTYESKHSTDGDAGLGIENVAVKGGSTGSGSIFSSGSGQANLGLPGIGIGSRSSSLDASGIEATDAKVTGLGLSKPAYESILSTSGDAGLGIENAGVRGGATGSRAIFSSGLGQANLGLPGIGSGSSSLDASGIRAADGKVTGLDVSKTTYESIDSTGGDAGLGIENAAVKGGVTGSDSIFSSGSGQANLGLPGIGIGSGSSSLDASGIKATEAKVTGSGVSKTRYESIHSSGGDAGLEIENAAVKGGVTGSGSIFTSGSGQGNLGLPGFGVSKTTYKPIHSTGGVAALNIEQASVIPSLSGSSQKVNTGVPNIGIWPGCGSFEVTDVKTSGAELTSFDISKTSHSSKGSKIEDATISSGIDQKANVAMLGVGVLPGVSSSVVATGGYENDKFHAHNFEVESGISKNPHPIIDETLTSQKQNTKEESVGHVLDGSYNVKNNHDKSDYSKCNGEENGKFSINSGDSILNPNLEVEGSAAVQGSIQNGQSLSSAGQSFESKLNGQTETQNKQELLYDVGKIGVTGGFPTASSHGVKEESTFHNTQHFEVHAGKHGESNIFNHQSSASPYGSTSSVGTQNLGQPVPCSTKSNDEISATFESGIISEFNTGNLNQAGHQSQDSKFGSYLLTSPFYPGYKVVDNRHKLSGNEGVMFSTNSSPFKSTPVVDSQGLHFPLKNTLNLDLNTPIISPQYRQHPGLTSSHYNFITQTYVPSFISAFPKLSTNSGQLSSTQGSYSSNGNQDSFSHKSTYFSDQKPLAQSQPNQKSSELRYLHTQFGSTSGSQFLEKAMTVGISTQIPAVFEKKFTKSESTHSSSSSHYGGSKDQFVQSSQSSVKPSGSSQRTGSGFSQTQFGSMFESQSGLNSQKVVGSVPSKTFQVQPNSQKDVKQSGLQDSHKYSQQSQYSSTSGSQFGKKPESTGTISHTFPDVGQKTIISSQTSTSYEKPHIGFTSSSLTNSKSVTTHSSSSSHNGGSKDQFVQSSQSSVRPSGSSQRTGSGFSQTQFGSTFGSQSGLNSQKVVGSVSSTTFQVQPNSQKDVKQSGLQDSHKYSQQSQYSSISGSQFGKKPESTGTISHTFPAVGQRTTISSQTSTSYEKPHIGFTSSSLTSTKSVATHSSSSSHNGGSKDQFVQSSQSSVIPSGSLQRTGTDFSQTQFGGTFGGQSGLKSPKVVGAISSTSSQFHQNFQNDVKQSGLQDSHKNLQQSQYSSISGSQFRKKPESTETISHIFPAVGQKTTISSQTSTSYEKPHIGFTSSSLTSTKSEATHSSSSFHNGGSKDQFVQSSQSSVIPSGSSQSTESGFSKIQLGNSFGSQSGLNAHKVAGAVSSTTFQVQPNSQNYLKQSGLQDSHKYSLQSEYNSTTGSQFGKKPESTGTISHTFPDVGQKTIISSQTSTSYEKPHIGFTSSSLTNSKSVTTHSSSSSHNGGSKDQFVQSSQSSVIPSGSSQSTESGFSKIQLGNSFGSQSGLNAHKVAGAVSSTTFQVQPNSQKDLKQSGLQDSHKYSQQSEYSSTTGSQFGKKPESTGTISHTFPDVGQKTIISSKTSTSYEKPHIGFTSSSLTNSKSEATHSSSSFHNGGSKDQFVQLSQSSVRPSGSSQRTESGFSQIQFGSTFGSQSSLNAHKVAGAVSSTTFQVQPNSQKDVKQSGLQDSHKYSQQSQYSSTTGSQFGKKPESTGTISHTFPAVGQKTIISSQTSTSYEKPHIGFTSSSLTNSKSVTTHSSSSSHNGGSKDQFVQSSQSSVIPSGSSQSTESGFSKIQLGNSFGSQSGLNAYKVAGAVSSTTFQVQPNSQKDLKQSGLQDSHKYSQQSEYSSTTGSQFGKKPESTGTISHTFPDVGQKTIISSQTSTSYEKPHIGFTSSSLTSPKLEATHSSSSSHNGGSKDQFVQSSQSSVKPSGSSQRTGSGFSQTQFGSTFGSQSGLNSQEVVGSVSSKTFQVQPNSQKDVEQSGLQGSHKYSQQSQYSSTTGSQFGKKPDSTGTISHTFPAVGQKTSISSQTSTSYEKPHIGFTSSSLTNSKSVTTHSSSSSHNGGSKDQFVQSSQSSVRPSVSSQRTGSGFSQTQFGSTFGSQSGLNAHKVAGAVSSTTFQVQPNSQKDVKQSGLQDSHKYSQQSQYSSTTGSQFGKKPDSTGTISHTFPAVGQKTTISSQTSTSYEKPHIGFTSSSLTSPKLEATHSSSSSHNGGSKDQFVQSSQSSVKPSGSSQRTGSGFSQTQFGSTFGSQSGLNSQEVVGSVSSKTFQVQPTSQKDVKQSGLQESHKYSQQSQYSSTTGSQFGKKPESTGTISHTFPAVGQRTTISSQTSTSYKKPHIGFTSNSLTSTKSEVTHSSSTSHNGGSKDQFAQSSQSSVKPSGSSQTTGSGFSQTQFGSTIGSQSDLNAHKVVGSVSSTTFQVQPNSQKDVKHLGLQNSHKYSQQSQYSSISGSQFGKKPESTETISHAFPDVGQKTTISSQTSTSYEKPHIGFTSSSLTSPKLEATHSSSSSHNGGSKDQFVQSSQSSVKPSGSSQRTGSGFSQTQFGSTFGSQSGLNSQEVVGSVSSKTFQVQPNSQKDVEQSGLQGSHKYSQQSQYSSTSGSQFGKKPESTGTISHTFPDVGQKTIISSETSTSYEKPHIGFTSSSLTNSKSVTTHSSSSSHNGGSKDQFVQSSQSSVRPSGSSQRTGSGFSQTQFGSTFGSQSGLNSQKVVGSVSSTTFQVQPTSQKDVKQSGLQDSHKYSQQSQYSSISGSQFGKKPESTGTISHTFPAVGQRTTISSQTSTSYEKPHIGFTSNSLTSTKTEVTHSSSSSHNGGSKDQFAQSSQSSVKPSGSSQTTGSGFSQTQFGSTIGSQSDLNAHKVVGSVSSTTFQVQPNSQKDVKHLGLQNSHKYSQQSQYSSISGSQFGKKPESTETISHAFSDVGQKTTISSQTSTSYEKPHIGFTSSSLTSPKLEATHSSSSSHNGGSKDQFVQSSQSSVKPSGSSQRTGSGFSQTQFGSTFGSQSGLNSQEVLGSVSSKTFQVQPNSQKDVKQSGLQGGHKYSQQSQYSSTSGSQFGKKPESTGTISHTFPDVGQKTIISSETSTSYEKPHIGFTSSSLTNSKSVTTHSSSSSHNGGSKDQFVQSSQSSVRPSVSSQRTGSGFSQTQFGSTFGSQSGLNAHKVAGAVSSTTFQVQPNSQKDVKQSGLQDSHKYSQQSQYSSTTGSQFGKKPDSTGTISHTFPAVGQKTTISSQTSTSYEEPHIGFTSSSLTSPKLEATHSSSSSHNGGSKDQFVQSSQSSVKPSGSSQRTGSGFSQTQFGSTFGSQSGLNSQEVVGSVSSKTFQVQPNSQKDVEQSGLQGSHKYSQQSQYSSTSGSQFGKKPESTGTISHTFPDVGQKTIISSETSTSYEKPHIGFTSSSLTNSKSVTTHSSSSSYNGGSKDQFVQSSQLSVRPSGSSQRTGSGFSQTQFGSAFGSQSGLNSTKVVGSTSSTTSQIHQNSQKDVKQSGSQDSQKYLQQFQYSSTSGSQFGTKPELAETISHTFPDVGQKKTDSDYEKTWFGFSSGSFNSEKTGSTQTISSSYNGESKGQSVQSPQLNVKPIGSSQSTRYGLSNTQLISPFGTQSGHSQKDLGTINAVVVQPISEYRKKPFSSQSDHNTYQQSQFSSTTGTDVESLTNSNLYHISSHPEVVGQKSLGTLQVGSGNENSLLIKKSQSIESNSFSHSSVLNAQAEQTKLYGLKPYVYPQTTGSSFSKIQLGSTFGSPYDKQSFGRHYGSHQDTLLGLVTGSQDLSGQIHSVKPNSFPQLTGSGSQKPQLSFSLRDLVNQKPQSTFSKSISQSYTSQHYNTANKPLDSIQTPLHRHSGVGIRQNHESSASVSTNSGSFSNTHTGHVSKYQTSRLGLQPIGGPLTKTKVFHSIFDQSVSKLANTVPGAQIPISVTEKSSELSSIIGKGETFGGPRDPPSFDIKTGYHY